ncbi:MAG: hypothetical protein AAB421_04965 [Patescibacteria group bacterium]
MEIPKIPKTAEELKAHTTPDKLEYYAFLWSEARLALGAVALLAGGIPVVRLVIPFGFLSGITGLILTVAWIISGVASAYLGYRWYIGGRKIFGAEEMKDTIAFLVSTVSGLNLGITGLSAKNIGMTIFSAQLIYSLTAILYITTALYLYWRWNSAGKKLF